MRRRLAILLGIPVLSMVLFVPPSLAFDPGSMLTAGELIDSALTGGEVGAETGTMAGPEGTVAGAIIGGLAGLAAAGATYLGAKYLAGGQSPANATASVPFVQNQWNGVDNLPPSATQPAAAGTWSVNLAASCATSCNYFGFTVYGLHSLADYQSTTIDGATIDYGLVSYHYPDAGTAANEDVYIHTVTHGTSTQCQIVGGGCGAGVAVGYQVGQNVYYNSGTAAGGFCSSQCTFGDPFPTDARSTISIGSVIAGASVIGVSAFGGTGGAYNSWVPCVGSAACYSWTYGGFNPGVAVTYLGAPSTSQAATTPGGTTITVTMQCTDGTHTGTETATSSIASGSLDLHPCSALGASYYPSSATGTVTDDNGKTASRTITYPAPTGQMVAVAPNVPAGTPLVGLNPATNQGVTAQTAVNTTLGPSPANLTGDQNCWSGMVSWDPTDWVVTPVKCVLTWAFVPPPGSLPSVTVDWSPLKAWMPSLPGNGAEGCGPMSLTMPNSGMWHGQTITFADTCSEPYASAAGWVKGIVTVAVVGETLWSAFFLFTSAIGAGQSNWQRTKEEGMLF